MAVLWCKLMCPKFMVMRGQRLTMLRVKTFSSQAPNKPWMKPLAAASAGTLHPLNEILKRLYKNSSQRASATAKGWWEKYEDFVGVTEVREAQGKVAEAEKAFMVARAIVRDFRDDVEFQQIKLKEIRDRLDRIPKEDVQYLEMATQEHKCLQEEKRIRTGYMHAEDSEREQFSLFSAAVREAHEKERSRAERTKNWSVIGSVLGAIIGVVGSTYINRVRLQELKALLLEAQKGPVSLQDALHEQESTYRLQQKDLSDAIFSLRQLIVGGGKTLQPGSDRTPTKDPIVAELNKQADFSHKMYTSIEKLQKQFGTFGSGLTNVTNEVRLLKATVETKPVPRSAPLPSKKQGDEPFTVQDVILELEDTKQSLKEQMNRNTCFTTALTCAVFAFTAPILYVLLKGN